MSIKSELLEVLERRHRPNKETQRNHEMLTYLFGFGEAPAPTVDAVGRKFGVSKQRVSEVLNRDLIDAITLGDLPSLDRLHEIVESREFWSYTELLETGIDSGLVGDHFHIEGIFSLRDFLRLSNDYGFYSVDLKPLHKNGSESEANRYVIANRIVGSARRLLTEARHLAGAVGIARMDDLLSQNAALVRVHPLIQEAIGRSGDCWTYEENGTLWYVFETSADGRRMPQTPLRTYSEKVFGLQTTCSVEKLAISYCNALADRSKEAFHVPIKVMENYLRNSSNFRVVGERVGYRGSGKQPSKMETAAVQFLKDVGECDSPTLKDELLRLFPKRKDSVKKQVFYSPLVFVDTTQGRGNYRFSWVGWEGKNWEAEKLRQRETERLRQRLEDLEATVGKAEKTIRLEQHLLRRLLFGRQRRAGCAICGNEFPVAALLAAHKKKRSACSEDERKDPNIVMPLCVFGCDFLYEQRYVRVVDRKVVEGHPLNENETAAQYLEKLVGRELAAEWWEDSESYFAWGWS